MMAFLNWNGLNAKVLYIYFENGYTRQQVVGQKLKLVSDNEARMREFDEEIQKELFYLNIKKYNLRASRTCLYKYNPKNAKQ